MDDPRSPTPAGTRPGRRGTRLGARLAVVALVTGLGACTADDASTDDSPTRPPSAPATPAPTVFASPPDGAQVVVAETGFSTSPYEPDPSAELLSYGVIVENPGRYVAADVVVHIHLRDAEGRTIDEITGEPADDPQRQAVTRLLPGERIGLGRTVPHYGAEVADMAVEVEVGGWTTVDDGIWWHRPVTTREVTTRESAGVTTVSVTVDAAYTSDMVRGRLWIGGHFTAIFRDGTGAIVGGADCCHGTGRTQVEVPPGRSQAELHLENGTPARADLSRTEVYLPDPQENLPG
ncbi:MAG: hypothetical protein FWJ70_08015 [Micromonosporaceae bacterium]|jgi:hypothetical protein